MDDYVCMLRAAWGRCGWTYMERLATVNPVPESASEKMASRTVSLGTQQVFTVRMHISSVPINIPLLLGSFLLAMCWETWWTMPSPVWNSLGTHKVGDDEEIPRCFLHQSAGSACSGSFTRGQRRGGEAKLYAGLDYIHPSTRGPEAERRIIK